MLCGRLFEVRDTTGIGIGALVWLPVSLIGVSITGLGGLGMGSEVGRIQERVRCLLRDCMSLSGLSARRGCGIRSRTSVSLYSHLPSLSEAKYSSPRPNTT